MKDKGYGPLVSCTTVQNCTSVKVNCSKTGSISSCSSTLISIFFKRELPNLAKPTFSDLHPSLGNLDHMQVYINHAIISVHPHGTGWEGC
ncbi:hypothetical protein F5876DRAFT_36895 [Lentinula aff. lateritia]|uniref:Uncharacterized protein n=1 Tax=Lentinula aff. lateritia TaxID=2804960 RepID=A0ACC1U6M4_9AGAR|nr:hypothetical protein F5876DRAFT_36895 [Lentinula aff. lateritia]